MQAPTLPRRLLVVSLALCAVLAGGAVGRVQDVCGPFTDVSAALCPYVLEVYALGISAGTSPTTYSPDSPLTRGQAAVFVSKGVNQAIARSSRRAALGQWWTTQSEQAMGTTIVGMNPSVCASDGTDVWTRIETGVARVRASDGRLIETWDTPPSATGTLVAMGRIFVAGYAPPNHSGHLYMIDPAQLPGLPTEVASTSAGVLAFDGRRIWATKGAEFALDIITPGPTLPWTTTSVQIPGGSSEPTGILFDGSNIWISVTPGSALMKLDENGAVLQVVPFDPPAGLGTPVFDGSNIWVPDFDGDAVKVVRVSDGAVVATLTGNGLEMPLGAAFDGTRVLITTLNGVSVWNAATLTPVTHVSTSSTSSWPCSDGISFFIPQVDSGSLARF